MIGARLVVVAAAVVAVVGADCPGDEWRAPLTVGRPPDDDACTFYFLDFGSNVGVQARKLFEPHLYPARGRSFYDVWERVFGADRAAWRRDVCVVGFEPNPAHAPRLRELAERYAARGWRTTYYLAGVGAADGVARFRGPANDIQAAARFQPGCDPRAAPAPVVDVAAVLRKYARAAGVVAKVDIEGYERGRGVRGCDAFRTSAARTAAGTARSRAWWPRASCAPRANGSSSSTNGGGSRAPSRRGARRRRRTRRARRPSRWTRSRTCGTRTRSRRGRARPPTTPGPRSTCGTTGASGSTACARGPRARAGTACVRRRTAAAAAAGAGLADRHNFFYGRTMSTVDQARQCGRLGKHGGDKIIVFITSVKNAPIDMSSKNSPLESAAQEFVKVAFAETAGGKMSKEIVTELKGLNKTIVKLNETAGSDAKDATVLKVEAKIEALRQETVKVAAAVSAVQASNDRAVKLAKIQILQWAISNVKYTCMKSHWKSEVIVKDILFSFTRNYGRNLNFAADNQDYRKFTGYYSNHPKTLGEDQEAVDDLVVTIHKLTGTKPRVETGKDGRKVIYQS